MTITYNLERKEGYALVTARGRFDTLDDLLSYLQALLPEVLDMGEQCALLDHRGIAGELDTTKTYNSAVAVTDKVAEAKRLRIAAVTSPERFEHLQFFETVAQNRGMMMLSFRSMDEARAWLLGIP